MSIQSYQDLQVWQRGLALAEQAYRLTQAYPRSELFGLTAQIRRAAASIPANIAEGWGRSSRRELRRFLTIAMGSLKELETHLILSQRVGLLNPEQLQPVLQETEILGKQILTFMRKLEA